MTQRALQPDLIPSSKVRTAIRAVLPVFHRNNPGLVRGTPAWLRNIDAEDKSLII